MSDNIGVDHPDYLDDEMEDQDNIGVDDADYEDDEMGDLRNYSNLMPAGAGKYKVMMFGQPLMTHKGDIYTIDLRGKAKVDGR